jgi:hypothetical protein
MYFFDTYALVELVKGNPLYRKYSFGKNVTTKYNLIELYYTLLRLFDVQVAERYFTFFNTACVQVGDDILKSAMMFRLEQRKKKNLISYIDCIGYFVAHTHNLRFLTGEKHFKNLPNVEYVK